MRRLRFPKAVAIGGSILAFAVAPHMAMAASPVKVIYSFKGGTDGAVPVGPLVDIGGTLYGTTSEGGNTGCGGNGCGTVFAIGPSGGERVIHIFTGSPDGATPLAGLVNVQGTLYGTTYDGGKNKCGTSLHCGTVFSIGVNGGEQVVYNFKGGKDGAFPSTDLAFFNGLLYGATYAGGGNKGCATGYTCGTFFSVSRGGAENVLYAFGGIDAKDGGNPSGSLITIGTQLFGTTEFGGLASCNKSGSADEGCGTVYSMTTGGGEKVLHSFAGGFDGRLPVEGVIDVDNVLFGTAYEGGSGSTCAGGCGILYSMSLGGTESILHSFGAKAADGMYPSGLIFVTDNTLGDEMYGVTFGGGKKGCSNTKGCGIAYSASRGGTVSVLHNFGSDAGNPQEADSRLIELGSKLYGVSHRGGKGTACSTGPDGSTGCGTVYQLTP